MRDRSKRGNKVLKLVTVTFCGAMFFASGVGAQELPNLVGQWSYESDFAVHHKTEDQAPTISKAKLVFEIVEQQGDIVIGREVSQDLDVFADAWPALETFLGVINDGGERLDIVDSNGRHECVIVSADELDCIY